MIAPLFDLACSQVIAQVQFLSCSWLNIQVRLQLLMIYMSISLSKTLSSSLKLSQMHSGSAKV